MIQLHHLTKKHKFSHCIMSAPVAIMDNSFKINVLVIATIKMRVVVIIGIGIRGNIEANYDCSSRSKYKK